MSRTKEQRSKAKEQPPAAAPPAGKLLTRAQLAKHFDVTQMTITRWERDGMPVAVRAPRGKPSLFDVEAVEEWKAVTDAARGDESASLSTARAKLADAQRERVEIDIATRRGDVVLRDQVIREGQALVKGWTALLRSLPRRAAQLGVIETRQIGGLEELVREVLTEISNWKTVADAKRAAKRGQGAAA